MKLIKPHKWYLTVVLMATILLLTIQVNPILSQTRTHNVGDLKLRIEADETINTNDVEPTGEWPQDHFRYANIVFYNAGHAIGSWIDSTGVVHSKEAELWPVSYNQTEPYGIQEYRRYEPPEVWVYVNGQDQLSSRRFNGIVDPNLPADQMIEVRYKSYPGFDVLKRSYSFSNPNHNDYVIHWCRYKCTFDWDQDPDPDTNTGQTMEDVYFIVGYCFQTAEGTYITYSRWYEEGKDDWATYEAYSPQLVTGGRQLHISYSWDGDHPELTEFTTDGPEFDDTGDPRHAIGSGGDTPMPSAEFVSSAYAGFAALHVDTAPDDHTDDINQPTSVIGNMNIYDVWDSNFPGFATQWDWAASGTKQTVEDQAGWPDDAMAQEAEYPFQSFGPFDFNLGDSVVIVYAVGVNGISRDLAREKGLEWRAWYKGDTGADFDDDAKNSLLATGRDSLFQTFDRALWAWDRGLNVPAPLPSPDLNITSGPNVVYLEWEDLSQIGDANTGVPDLHHYNIYRKKGKYLVDTYDELNAQGTHLVWEKIAEVAASETTYTDSAVVRGDAYHYAVTAVDNGQENTDGLFPGQRLESSIYANRAEISAIPFAPGAETTNQVRVVPNPYIAEARDFNFSEDPNRILFANLPPYCTLRIYTVTGDLIKTIKHESGSADELWDQVTESNQFIASGVYILQVSDAKDFDDHSLPEVNVKFVVVR